MAKKKVPEIDNHPEFISLRMINPSAPDKRVLIEGIPCEQLRQGTSVLIQDGKRLVPTGIILAVRMGEKGSIITAEGEYEIFHERLT